MKALIILSNLENTHKHWAKEYAKYPIAPKNKNPIKPNIIIIVR